MLCPPVPPQMAREDGLPDPPAAPVNVLGRQKHGAQHTTDTAQPSAQRGCGGWGRCATRGTGQGRGVESCLKGGGGDAFEGGLPPPPPPGRPAYAQPLSR